MFNESTTRGAHYINRHVLFNSYSRIRLLITLCGNKVTAWLNSIHWQKYQYGTIVVSKLDMFNQKVMYTAYIYSYVVHCTRQ